MNKRANINDIFYAIGRRDNISNLELDQNACTGLQLNNGETIFFEWQEQADALFIYMPLSKLPDKEPQRALQLQTLLTLNCLAHGAIFALKADHSEVLLQQSLPYASLSMEQLDKAIDQLIAQSIAFKQTFDTRLAQPHQQMSKPSSHQTLTHNI